MTEYIDGFSDLLSDNEIEKNLRCEACEEKVHYQKMYEHMANCTEWDEILTKRVTDFGLLIPNDDARIVWNQQAGGVLCHQKYLRGDYIPLDELFENDNWGKLPRLQDANYRHDEKRVREIWEYINRNLPFEYEKTEPPEDYYPETEEAWRWITITNGVNWAKQLEGVTCVLIYPNSD